MTTATLSEQLQAQIAERNQTIAEYQAKWVDAQNSGNWIMSEHYMSAIEQSERTIGELNGRLVHLLLEEIRLLTAELARARQQVGGAVNIIQYQLSQQQRTEHLLHGGNHED